MLRAPRHLVDAAARWAQTHSENDATRRRPAELSSDESVRPNSAIHRFFPAFPMTAHATELRRGPTLGAPGGYGRAHSKGKPGATPNIHGGSTLSHRPTETTRGLFFPAHSANEAAMQSRPTGRTKACRGLFWIRARRVYFFPITRPTRQRQSRPTGRT